MNTVLTKARLTVKHVFNGRKSVDAEGMTLQQNLLKIVKRQKKHSTQHAMFGVVITSLLVILFM